jgi:hypothetical protein
VCGRRGRQRTRSSCECSLRKHCARYCPVHWCPGAIKRVAVTFLEVRRPSPAPTAADRSRSQITIVRVAPTHSRSSNPTKPMTNATATATMGKLRKSILAHCVTSRATARCQGGKAGYAAIAEQQCRGLPSVTALNRSARDVLALQSLTASVRPPRVCRLVAAAITRRGTILRRN